jgi:hypothetical protein
VLSAELSVLWLSILRRIGMLNALLKEQFKHSALLLNEEKTC